LTRELDAIAAAGFGCVEVQSFAVGLPRFAPSSVFTYGTDAWFASLEVVLDRARDLALTVDITLGSSWPSAGTYISDAQALQQLTITGALVRGPGRLDEPFPSAAEPRLYSLAYELLRLPNTFRADKMTPVALMAFHVADVQQPVAGTPSAITGLPDLPPPTYLDPSSIVDLSTSLSGDRIRWDIPDGNWVVLAFHTGPTGMTSFYGADPGPALVLDHFNEAAVDAHLRAVAQPAVDLFGPHVGTYSDVDLRRQSRAEDGAVLDPRFPRGVPHTPWLRAAAVSARAVQAVRLGCLPQQAVSVSTPALRDARHRSACQAGLRTDDLRADG
jgi:hypothetical protein